MINPNNTQAAQEQQGAQQRKDPQQERAEKVANYNYFNTVNEAGVPILINRNLNYTGGFISFTRALLLLKTLEEARRSKAFEHNDHRGGLLTSEFLLSMQKKVGVDIFDFDNCRNFRNSNDDYSHEVWASLQAASGHMGSWAGNTNNATVWQGVVPLNLNSMNIIHGVLAKLQGFSTYFLLDERVDRKLPDTQCAIEFLIPSISAMMGAMASMNGSNPIGEFICNYVDGGVLKQRILYTNGHQ